MIFFLSDYVIGLVLVVMKFYVHFQVVGWEPRPTIKITPPSNAKDTRPQVYRYVEAVKTLPTNFTATEVEFIFQKVNPKLCGQLRSLFVCLSDDAFRKTLNSRSKPQEDPIESESDQPADDETEDVEMSEGNVPPSSSQNESNASSGKSGKSDKKSKTNRGPKRGASSPPENAVPQKK